MITKSATKRKEKLYLQLKKTTNPEEMRKLELKIQTIENTVKK